MADNMIPQQQMQQISSASFAAKFKSKRGKCLSLSLTFHLPEVYFFLTVECKYYLPACDTVTIYFLKDIVSGTRRAMKGTDIVHLACPQYETLSTEKILDWARTQQSSLGVYLPVEKEIAHLPKQFLVNLIYANLGQAFANWIQQRINERNAEIASKRDMLINVDPIIANAFQGTTHISTSKGNGAHLL